MTKTGKSKKIKLVADDKIPFLQGVLEPFAQIDYFPGAKISKENVIDADALIVRTRTKCDKHLLDGTNVKLITTATIGHDHIDIDYCHTNGIKWVNAPGCNSTSVMQYIASVLVHFAENNNFNLQDKTIGIIGVGNVGRKVQSLATILGMNVLLNDPPRMRLEGPKNFSSIDQIKERSDIISFHVPLNKTGKDKTYHLVNKDFFNDLKRKPIIINSSRGEVIETNSLIGAIRNSLISGTCLDVWENEPEINYDLLKVTDIATPHIAGYSSDGKANGTAVCVNSVNQFFNLGLEADWFPENLPLPIGSNKIKIEGKNKSEQEILSDVINATYNVKFDDNSLRNDPGKFEKLRGDYRVRREFNTFEVKLKHCSSLLIEKLIKLTFQINCK